MIHDYSLLNGSIWFDGNIIPWCDAKVHILTQAMNYAYSVFEGIRLYNGKIFKLKEHIERIHNSAQTLNFRIPFNTQELSHNPNIIIENKLSNAYIQILAWKEVKRWIFIHLICQLILLL